MPLLLHSSEEQIWIDLSVNTQQS